VSALFMTDTLDNAFYRESSVGAMSDWIVTAPTKRFYVDPAVVANTVGAPFDTAFIRHYTGGSMTVGGSVTEEWGSAFPYACDDLGAAAYDEDGRKYLVQEPDDGGGADGGDTRTSPSLTPCLETSVFAFSTHDGGTGDSPLLLPDSMLGSNLTNGTDPGNHVASVFGAIDSLPTDGHLHLDLAHDAAGNLVATRKLTAAANGDVLRGLPVIGFLAVRYVNANVSAGVLSNYSSLTASKSSVLCTGASGGGC
jgi:hypothetical protein